MTGIVPILLAGQAILATSDPDEAVRFGRGALDHWWGYPWYDAGTDGVQRIDVKEPYAWDWLRDWTESLRWTWNQIRDWLESWDWGCVPFASGLHWPTTILGWIACTVIIALLAVLVYLLSRTYRRWAGRFGDGTDQTASAAEEEEDLQRRVDSLPFPVARRKGDLLVEARQCHQQGNYGEAIIYLFSYQLVQLDKHRVIHLAKGKTNRQYLREVGPRTALRRLLEQTMVTFEDVFFGNHAIDRARFDRCWSGLDRFEALTAEAAS